MELFDPYVKLCLFLTHGVIRLMPGPCLGRGGWGDAGHHPSPGHPPPPPARGASPVAKPWA
jgi:hypothetical protein